MLMLEMRGNVNTKESYERQETTSWVKDMRRRGKREAVPQKKNLEILASRAAPPHAAGSQKTYDLSKTSDGTKARVIVLSLKIFNCDL